MRVTVNKEERALIMQKMDELGTKNLVAYASKMLIDGYIIKVDYPEQKAGDGSWKNRIQHQSNLQEEQSHKQCLSRRYWKIERPSGVRLGRIKKSTG